MPLLGGIPEERRQPLKSPKQVHPSRKGTPQEALVPSPGAVLVKTTRTVRNPATGGQEIPERCLFDREQDAHLGGRDAPFGSNNATPVGSLPSRGTTTRSIPTGFYDR